MKGHLSMSDIFCWAIGNKFWMHKAIWVWPNGSCDFQRERELRVNAWFHLLWCIEAIINILLARWTMWLSPCKLAMWCMTSPCKLAIHGQVVYHCGYLSHVHILRMRSCVNLLMDHVTFLRGNMVQDTWPTMIHHSKLSNIERLASLADKDEVICHMLCISQWASEPVPSPWRWPKLWFKSSDEILSPTYQTVHSRLYCT